MAIEIEKNRSINEEKNKLSPREQSILKRYGVLNKTENKRKARTINELYKQRYRIKNH